MHKWSRFVFKSRPWPEFHSPQHFQRNLLQLAKFASIFLELYSMHRSLNVNLIRKWTSDWPSTEMRSFSEIFLMEEAREDGRAFRMEKERQLTKFICTNLHVLESKLRCIFLRVLTSVGPVLMAFTKLSLIRRFSCGSSDYGTPALGNDKEEGFLSQQPVRSRSWGTTYSRRGTPRNGHGDTVQFCCVKNL